MHNDAIRYYFLAYVLFLALSWLTLQKAPSAMHQVYLRYARALGLTAKECNLTLEQAIRLVDSNSPRPAKTVSPA